MFEFSYLSIVGRIGDNLEKIQRSSSFQKLPKIGQDFSCDLSLMFQLEKALLYIINVSRIEPGKSCGR